MAQQIKNKFIGNDQVDGSKILLENNQSVRAKDSLGAEKDILKLDEDGKVLARNHATDETAEIAFKSQVDAEEAARIAGDSAIEAELVVAQGDIESLQTDLGIAQGQISTLQTDVSNVEQSVAAVGIDLDAAELSIVQLQTDVSVAQTNITDLQNDKVNRSGDAMQGSLNFGGAHKVTGLADATDSSDAVNKGQLDTAIDVNVTSREGQGFGLATLDSNGKLAFGQIPSIAIVDTFVVDDELEMLALSTAEKGDVAVRVDLNKSFILAGTDPSTLADWQELLTPTDNVLSVNTQTGVVQLDAEHIPVESISGVTGSDVQEVLEDLKSQIDGAVAGSDSKQVKISADDNSEGYLEDKIVGEAGKIQVSTIADIDGNEQLLIKVDADVALVSDVDAALASANAYTDAAVASEETDRIAADEALQLAIDNVVEDLADHISQEVGAHAASAISTTAIAGTTGADVQAVLASIQSNVSTVAGDLAQEVLDREAADIQLNSDIVDVETALQAHLDNTTDAHDASAISYVNTSSGLAATQVQAAIDEVEARVDALEGALAPTWGRVKFDLETTDITNGYVDLAHEAVANSISAFVDRLAIHQEEDFTLSVVGGVTRITFAGALVDPGRSNLDDKDNIYVRYQYLA
jgi:hypothetical protein